ncbi:ABC transporter permease subunit [uncultured Sphaerochaeta sp.]|uniref:ABC transporter permease n=1 Tax=uncultured Sphaerochaeta sp. TaxID=886478 RepID=UPI002A0A80BF|nr:ABC transporter permease subunit [uncultured Sphaerochaeta sp.]
MKPDRIFSRYSLRLFMQGLLSFLLPLAFGIVFIYLWQHQVFHRLLNVKVLQLPLPSRILSVLLENTDKLFADSLTTAQTAVTGLIIGSSAGFLVAILATLSPKWGNGALTVLAACNAIPVVALSPIMNVWFSNPMVAKAAVVSILSMVAMSVNAYQGLTNLKPFSLNLMHSYAASNRVIFFKLRLPNCIPYVFVGLRINVASAMIGAIVSEYFSSASNGLGYGIRNKLSTGQFPLGWAYIIAASLIGIILYTIVIVFENCALKHRSH